MCFCLLMIACSKESTLESRINLDELYVIQDDPDDPVKHRIYEIYETYGIPVYFNDREDIFENRRPWATGLSI